MRKWSTPASATAAVLVEETGDGGAFFGGWLEKVKIWDFVECQIKKPFPSIMMLLVTLKISMKVVMFMKSQGGVPLFIRMLDGTFISK